jgi:hypothetical protein
MGARRDGRAEEAGRETRKKTGWMKPNSAEDEERRRRSQKSQLGEIIGISRRGRALRRQMGSNGREMAAANFIKTSFSMNFYFQTPKGHSLSSRAEKMGDILLVRHNFAPEFRNGNNWKKKL